MRIQSIVAGAAIALIAGVGSVSADEITVADTAVNTGTPFVIIDGIPTEQMSIQELAATRGAASLLFGTMWRDQGLAGNAIFGAALAGSPYYDGD